MIVNSYEKINFTKGMRVKIDDEDICDFGDEVLEVNSCGLLKYHFNLESTEFYFYVYLTNLNFYTFYIKYINQVYGSDYDGVVKEFSSELLDVINQLPDPNRWKYIDIDDIWELN